MNKRIFAFLVSSLAVLTFALKAETTVTDDHGNNTAVATAVTLPSTVNGRLETAGDVDYFKFTLTAPAVVTATSGGTIDVGGHLVLGGVPTNEIYFDNDGAGAPNFRLSQLLPAGTHYVYVHPIVYGTLGNYTVTFTSAPPAAEQPDVTLATNGANLPAGTLVDFGKTAVSGLVTKDFMIGNAGEADLLVRGIRLSVSGVLPNGTTFPFRIMAAPAPLVAAGRQSTFRIGFQANVAGTYNGKFTVITNDGDEILYDIPIKGDASGTLPSPEIVVRNGTTDVANNGTIDFGSTQAGVRTTRDITVANTGASELKITSSFITVTGGNSTQTNPFSFYLSTPPTSVPAFGQGTFKIALYGLVAGNYAAKITLNNNDADENPTVINLTGVVTPDPVHGEIDVATGGTDLPNNSVVDYGGTLTGLTVTKDFVISNSGAAPLSLTSWSLAVPPPVTVNAATTTILGSSIATVADTSKLAPGMLISGPFASGTTITSIAGTQVVFSSPATASISNVNLSYIVGGVAATVQAFRIESAVPVTVAAGATATVKVSYLPVSTGSHSAVLTLYNNDLDENPFKLSLTGHADLNPNPADIAISLGGTDVPLNGDVDYGEVPANATVTKTFTLKNAGAGELRLLGWGTSQILPAPVTGNTTPLAFFYSSLPGQVLAAGQSTTFTVNFKPTATGTAYKSQLLITSNDPDESPYRINVLGAGSTIVTPVPEINVTQAGANVPNNGSLAYGSALTGTLITKPFVISNGGTAALSLTGASLIGSAGSTVMPFRLDNALPASLAAGASVTLNATFAPITPGDFGATLQIGNNDSDESPYRIGLSGHADQNPLAPEIAVRTGTTDVANNGTIDYGTLQTNVRLTKDITIANTGTSELKITGYSLISPGTIPSFSFYSSSPPSIVPAGGEATFKISLWGLVPGSFTSKLTLYNNDADENPTVINFAGTIAPDPVQGEIGVAVAGVDVPNNGSVAFGGTLTGITVTKDFVISNSSASELRLTSWSLSIPPTSSVVVPTTIAAGSTVATVIDSSKLAVGMVVSGPFPAATTIVAINGSQVTFSSPATTSLVNAALSYIVGGLASTVQAFRFEGALPSTIAAGASATLKVSYLPTSAGNHASILTIYNNDADENPFKINLSGHADLNANPADVALSLGGADLPLDSNVDYGTVPAGSLATKTFTISNTGGSELRVLSYSTTQILPAPVSGTTTVSAFYYGALPLSVIPAGQTATFTVTFKPATVGTAYKSQLLITSTDPDESPYKINVLGTGGAVSTTLPEIVVRTGGADVANNGTIDYGSLKTNVRLTKDITVANTGTAELKITGYSLAAPGSTSAFSFYASTPPASVPAGGEATFKISLWGLVPGNYTAKLTLNTNDTDENPTILNFAGTILPDAVQGEIGIALAGVDMPNNSSVSYGSTLAGIMVSKDFVISNSGSADLHLTSWSMNLPPVVSVLVPTTTMMGSPVATVSDSSKLAVGMAISGPFPSGTTIVAVNGTQVVFSGPATATVVNLNLSYIPGGTAALVQAFRFDSALPSTIVPGASATLKVSYLPVAAGNHASILTIYNNDADENPFKINLSGHADVNPNPADIAVSVDGADVPMDSNVDYGSVPASMLATKTFTIRNTGGSELRVLGYGLNQILPAPVAGTTNVSAFYYGALPLSVIPAGQTATFTATFKPAVVGTAYKSQIILTSTDPDEASYKINVLGTAGPIPIAVPDISVLQGTVELAQNAVVDFGSVARGTTLTKDITIKNLGVSNLTLSSYSWQVVAPLPAPATAAFSIASTPGATLAPGASGVLRLSFKPGALSTAYSTIIKINSNDPDENPFSLLLNGSSPATDSEIGIALDGGDLPNNGSVNFGGSTQAGAQLTKIITISNSGDAPLSLTGWIVQPPAGVSYNTTFRLGAIFNTVAPGTSVNIPVLFSPLTAGTHSAVLTINNSDLDEGVYKINLSGIAVPSTTPPEVGISVGGVDVPSGGTLALGSVALNTTVTRDLLITNTGVGDLRIGAYWTVAVGSTGTPAITTTQGPPTIIPAGGSAVWKISFKPTTAATNYQSTLTLHNSDADESAFVINVTGSAP